MALQQTIHHFRAIEKACEENDLDTVKRLFPLARADPQFSFNLMWALDRAVKRRHIDIITYLCTNGVHLSQGAIIPLIKAEDQSMLALLMDLGWDIKHFMGAMEPSALAYSLDSPRMVRWMLDRGTDPNARCAYNCTSMSFAVCTARPSVIGMLFAANASVHVGQLVHHVVAERRTADRVAVLRALLRRGASLEERADYGHPWPHPHRVLTGTALHCAAYRGDPGLVAELLRWGADPWAKDANGQAPWQVAEDQEHLELVPLLQRPRWIVSWCMFVGRLRRLYWQLRLRLLGPRHWESEVPG